jgi:hypothetical protein
MLTALDANPDSLDEHEKNFVAKIRQHGWRGTNVFPEGDLPGFGYTTGFWSSVQFPEVITFSLKSEAADQIFWNIFKDTKEGRPPGRQRRIRNILERMDVVLLPISKRHYAEHLGWSRRFYGADEFPSVQLFWPDRNNVFPWQSGFEREFEGEQPDLTEDGWDQIQLME